MFASVSIVNSTISRKRFYTIYFSTRSKIDPINDRISGGKLDRKLPA